MDVTLIQAKGTLLPHRLDKHVHGTFLHLGISSYRRRVREDVRTCPLRCKTAYNQPPLWCRIQPALTRSDLCPCLYGIKRLPYEDLRSAPNAPGNELVDCSEVGHGEGENVVAKKKGEDLPKLVRLQLHAIPLGWRQNQQSCLDRQRSPTTRVGFFLRILHTLSTETIL